MESIVMVEGKRKKKARGHTTILVNGEPYYDPNHEYFTEHFEELVDDHGGKWLVLEEGKLVAICEGSETHQYTEQIRQRGHVPFATPIPRPEEIECLL
jgi:hypothetical protein